MIGAPGNQEGRGSLFYSANPVFMSGRSILPNDTTGMNESSIRDQYQGKVILELEIKYNTLHLTMYACVYGPFMVIQYVCRMYRKSLNSSHRYC